MTMTTGRGDMTSERFVPVSFKPLIPPRRHDERYRNIRFDQEQLQLAYITQKRANFGAGQSAQK